jgi:hypothetical protein
MPGQRGCSKYTFRNYSGYVVAPWISDVTHRLVAIRHSAAVTYRQCYTLSPMLTQKHNDNYSLLSLRGWKQVRVK